MEISKNHMIWPNRIVSSNVKLTAYSLKSKKFGVNIMSRLSGLEVERRSHMPKVQSSFLKEGNFFLQNM